MPLQQACRAFCMAKRSPVHQDLPNLDALAAGAQGILHGLAAADYGHPAQLLRKVDSNIRMSSS